MLNPCGKFEKVFIVEPQVVIFGNYERDRPYIKCVTVKNNDALCDKVFVNFKENEEVSLNVKGLQRLGPGLDLEIEVTFVPNKRYKCQKKDRVLEVELTTEIRSKQCYKFLLPIILMSPNGSLTFPKEIVLPKTCPGAISSSTMYLCNNSPSTQRFSLSFPKDIIVKPYKKVYSMLSGKQETLWIQAKPGVVGDYKFEMQLLRCDCGKQDTIKLNLSCVECLPVYLKSSYINFNDAYLGMSSSAETKIVNDSDVKVKFKFIEEEADKDAVEGVCDRGKEENMVQNFFTINPGKGEIDPKSSLVVNIDFHPPTILEQTNGNCSIIHHVAHLKYRSGSSKEVAEIHMNGVVLGPKIVFTTNEIDLKSIHCGENIEVGLTCRNEGLIDGEITFQKIESLFGGAVTINSLSLQLKPNEEGSFNLKYVNCNIGRFVQKLEFKIISGGFLYIPIIGKVEKLTVQIFPEVVDFGQVSICCRQYQCIRLKNILNHPIKVDLQLEGQDLRQDETLLSFDEFEAIKPCKEFIPKVKSVVSFSSYLSDASEDEFSNVLEKLLVEYESSMESSDQQCSEETLKNSIFSSVEAVNSIIGQILCKFDDYLDIEDFRHSLQQNIHQMIDDWIDNKKLVELLVDDVLEGLMSEHEFNNCEESFVPFFDKDWTLEENSQKYSLGICTPLLLKPLEMQTFRLNVVPNWPGVFRTKLNVNVSWNDDRQCSSNFSIPLMHNCVIPDLVLCHTDFVQLDLFVNQTSCNIIRIRNLTEFIDGFVHAPFYENDEVQIKCTPEKEMVEKGSEVNLKLTVTPLVVGNLQYQYKLYILGNDEPLKITFKINSKPVRIKVDAKEISTNDMLPGDVQSAKFILMNLTPVQLEYQLRLAPHNHVMNSFQIEPYEPCLLPYDIVEVGIRQCFDTPGNYETCCFIDINGDYGKSQEVRIKCHVIGVPLKVLPEVRDNLLDLGLIIYNKKPFPTIEFSVENTGQVRYFVIPKLMYGEDFKVDESRVEIHPGEVQIIKLNICPKIPKTIHNALFFNASPTGMNKDFETFQMINFQGRFIKQKVFFTKNELSLKIRYDDDFDEKGHATIQLVNDSLIYLLVHCSINGDYELIDAENCQIGNFLDIELASKERRELTVQFNTELLLKNEYSTKSYPAKLKAYVDGKLQATTQVVTNLKYPTIEVDGTCLQVYQSQLHCFKSFSIHNIEDIDAEFSLEIIDDSLVFECLDRKVNSGVTSVIDEIFCNEKRFNVMENFLNEVKSLSEETDVELVEDPSEDEKDLPETKSEKTEKKKKKAKKVSIDKSIDEVEKPPKDKKSPKKKKKSSETTSVISTATTVSKKKISKTSIKGKKKKKNVLITEENVEEEPEVQESTVEITEDELQNALTEILDDFNIFEPLLSTKIEPEIISKSILKGLIAISPSSGTLQTCCSQSISLIFKPNTCLCKYSFDLRLYIKHGSPKTIKINVINDETYIDLDQNSIDLGVQPWFTLQRSSFTISTESSIPIHVKYLTNFDTNNDLLHGKLLLNEEFFKLNPKYKKHKAKLLIFLGFNPFFETIIGIEGNNRAPTLLKIVGQSRIPNLTFIGCHLLMNQSPIDDIQADYLALREMFNRQKDLKHKEIPLKLKNISKIEEMLVAPANSRVSLAVCENKDEIIDISEELFNSFDPCPIRLTADYRIEKYVQDSCDFEEDPYFDQTELDSLDYEVLQSYPSQNLPSFWEIKNFIEQNRLIHRLKNSLDVSSHVENLTKTYVYQKFNSFNIKTPPRYIYSGKPTNFPIEAIPEWCLPVQCYSLDFGDLKLGEIRQFSYEFVFHGPGTFNASIRSDKFVPGLTIKFQTPEAANPGTSTNEIPFKFTLKEYLPEPVNVRTANKGRYHPSTELSHSHSHDFTKKLVHVRKPLNPDEKLHIKQYYNQFNAKKITRDPNIYAEIYQETSRDASGQFFTLLFEFQPTSGAYGKKFTDFNEILHLDVHLGVSLPLHLRAKIFPKNLSCECLKLEVCPINEQF